MPRRTPPAPQLSLDFTAAPPPAAPAALAFPPADDAAFLLALARHALIESALRNGSPNPLPATLDDEEWELELAAFQRFGPLESALLQEAEARVDALVEFRPAYWPEEAPVAGAP